jgi:hypothetical protein
MGTCERTREVEMEDKAKIPDERDTRRWAEWIENAQKDDPELAEKLAVAKRVTERYSEALRRLADS